MILTELNFVKQTDGTRAKLELAQGRRLYIYDYGRGKYDFYLNSGPKQGPPERTWVHVEPIVAQCLLYEVLSKYPLRRKATWVPTKFATSFFTMASGVGGLLRRCVNAAFGALPWEKVLSATVGAWRRLRIRRAQ